MRIVFLFILSFALTLNSAFAADPIPNAGNFILAGKNKGGLETSTLVKAIDTGLSGGLVTILKVLYNIGGVVALCVFLVMAIQLLTASPQRKGQLKESMMPYFTGLLLFVAGVPIAILIINIIITIF